MTRNEAAGLAAFLDSRDRQYSAAAFEITRTGMTGVWVVLLTDRRTGYHPPVIGDVRGHLSYRAGVLPDERSLPDGTRSLLQTWLTQTQGHDPGSRTA